MWDETANGGVAFWREGALHDVGPFHRVFSWEYSLLMFYFTVRTEEINLVIKVYIMQII